MSDYGIKETGFNLKTYDKCLTEILSLFRQTFGKIREDSKSKFYQVAQILALREADSWEAFKALWDQFNLNAATGSFLDDLVACFGVTRIPATRSVVMLSAVCNEGTYVPAGTLFQCTTNNAQFVTLSGFTSTGPAMHFDAYASEYGIVSAPSGALTVVVTPVPGLTSVTNSSAASVGREEETDDALRYRFLSYARNYIGYCTHNAIKAKLEQKLVSTGKASAVNVFVNDTTETDTEGRPAHSIEVVVDCSSSDEIHNAVAQAIFEVKGATVPTFLANTYGVTGTAVDSDGFSHSINFSKIDTVPAYVHFSLYKSTETTFPSNGEDLIKEIVIAYGEKYMSKPGQDLLAGRSDKRTVEVYYTGN
jgi:hypothetical protein